MPKDLKELAQMISKRDGISLNEAIDVVKVCAADMEEAFFEGDLALAEDILKCDLGLEPDYLDLFIF